jgi:PBP1b-binding outer membrane lipoprotein LpoB
MGSSGRICSIESGVDCPQVANDPFRKACAILLYPQFEIMKRLSISILSILSLFLFASCATATAYQDPAMPAGARGWGAYEVKETARAMVSDLNTHLSSKDEPILIAFKPIRNRTSEHIDTEMLANQIRASLIEKKIYFVQLNLRGEIIQEMALGQSGVIDESAIPIGNLKSPNYYLEGVITDTTNYVEGRSVQYIVVTLNLTRTRTGVMEWTRNKEFLKSTRDEKIGW